MNVYEPDGKVKRKAMVISRTKYVVLGGLGMAIVVVRTV